MVVEWPVAWAEMDYFRHVNHAVFFTYFEGARIAYLERIGFRELSGGAAGGADPGRHAARATGGRWCIPTPWSSARG